MTFRFAVVDFFGWRIRIWITTPVLNGLFCCRYVVGYSSAVAVYDGVDHHTLHGRDRYGKPGNGGSSVSADG